MQKTIASKEYRELISWLKAARIKNKLSMRELGALLNEPHSIVGKIETLERRLDVCEYVTYCRALQVDPKQGIEILSKN